MAALLLTGILIYAYARASVRRYYVFGPYGNAVTHYYEKHKELPSELKAVEDAYNAYDQRRVPSLPVESEDHRPYYRPLDVTRAGSFLVLIEKKPQEWYFQRTRYVLYLDVAESSNDATRIRIERVDCSMLIDLVLANGGFRQAE